MSNESADLIRRAYQAYANGELATMLEFVGRGRHELESALEHQAERGLRAQLEEVVGHRDQVMVVVRTPGVDVHRVRQADDRNYSVFTVRDGRIVALRDCHDRQEALHFSGIQP
jgi:ketosteroid isomerase-like protein